MTFKTIEEEWQCFAAAISGETKPSETQFTEMKMAFFAGYWTLFKTLEDIGEPHITEKEGEAILVARKAECEAFKQKLIAEHAERN